LGCPYNFSLRLIPQPGDQRSGMAQGHLASLAVSESVLEAPARRVPVAYAGATARAIEPVLSLSIEGLLAAS